MLKKYAEHPYVTRKDGGVERVEDAADLLGGLEGILAVLRVRIRHDFRGYKKNTLVRRIERRMSLHDIRDMHVYRDFLRENPQEVKDLLDDLLIGVTSFFREPEAWQFLSDQAIKPLVESRSDDQPIRIWVPGCSTGQEAYSMAMLLVEQADAINHRLRAQVFGTDIDLESLNVAREAVFPESIADQIAPERLKRFFNKLGKSYQVRSELRDIITFAAQNIVADPPFSNMDVISCRNLLIYLETDVQDRLIELFHFALGTGRCSLFLGNSESVGQHEDLFTPVSRKVAGLPQDGQGTKGGSVSLPLVDLPATSMVSSLYRQVALPPTQLVAGGSRRAGPGLPLRHGAALVEANCSVQDYHGRVEDFLTFPAGEPTQDLLALVRTGLRSRLRTADPGDPEQTARRSASRPTCFGTTRRRRYGNGPARSEERCASWPSGRSGEPVEASPEASGTKRPSSRASKTSSRAPAGLQNTIEELETSNEELKASNEEAMSMNEELQSTNEELETSKEELQSLNEELPRQPQLQEKVEELEAANNDWTTSSTARTWPRCSSTRNCGSSASRPRRRMLQLIASDIGRPISDLASRVSSEELVDDASRCSRNSGPSAARSAATTDDGTCVAPCRTGRSATRSRAWSSPSRTSPK